MAAGYRDQQGKILVHVTEAELSFLEFVVRRFKADNEDVRQNPRLRRHNAENLDKSCDQNEQLCKALLEELSQAGT
jgi:lipoate-protein ligase A